MSQITNQDILDRVDEALPRKGLDPQLREQLLNDVWNRLSDNREDPEED